MKKPLVTHEG
jgi:pantoate kinase